MMRRAVKRVALPILLLAVAGCAASAADEALVWTNAGDCVGKACAVSGTIAEVDDDGPAIRLYFEKGRRDVCVTLVRSWLVSWPDYVGRSIVANGPVRRFRDVTEVMIHDPSQIQIAGAEPTPKIEFESPEKEEMQRLRDDVQRLENRVKELEGR